MPARDGIAACQTPETVEEIAPLGSERDRVMSTIGAASCVVIGYVPAIATQVAVFAPSGIEAALAMPPDRMRRIG
jgi:hypothetical protein